MVRSQDLSMMSYNNLSDLTKPWSALTRLRLLARVGSHEKRIKVVWVDLKVKGLDIDKAVNTEQLTNHLNYKAWNLQVECPESSIPVTSRYTPTANSPYMTNTYHM